MSKHLRLVVTAFVLLPGCGVLLGNVKPVAEKSSHYTVLELSRGNSEWIRLAPNSETDDETSDVAYQSKKTDSIIALNSVCRPRIASEEKNLRFYADSLFTAFSKIDLREEKPSVVSGVEALETTVTGVTDGQSIRLKAVVLQIKDCVYDLTYVSKPQNFGTHEEKFTQFVSSLRLD